MPRIALDQTNIIATLFDDTQPHRLPGVILFDRVVAWHGLLTQVVGPFIHDGEAMLWHAKHSRELDELGVKTQWETLTSPEWVDDTPSKR